MSDIITSREEDVKWILALKRFPCGRELESHLSKTEFSARNRGRCECPIQQIATFRRVFCWAFSEDPTCFALPRQTPPFIAIVNMSGERALFHTKNAALVRLLCLTGQNMASHVITSVQEVLDFARERGTSVLMCLSLPWQSGMSSASWEIRTIRRDPEGGVRDGEKCFSNSFDDGPRTVCSSNDTMSQEDIPVLQAQTESFATHIQTVSLDVSDEMIQQGVAETKKQRELECMKSVMQALREDRRKVMEELRMAKEKIRVAAEQHAVALKESERSAEARIAQVADKAKKMKDVWDTKQAEVQTMNKSLLEQVNSLHMQNRQLTASKAEQDLLFANERKTLQMQYKLQTAELKSVGDQFEELKKTTAREREQSKQLLTRSTEDMERRLNLLQINERKAVARVGEHQAAITRLEAVVDQLRNEKQACSFETLRQQVISRKAKISMRMLMMANRTVREQLFNVTLQHAALQKKAIEEASEVSMGSAGSAGSAGSVEAGASTTGETRAPMEVAVNTEPQQDCEELCTLRAEVGRLNETCEATGTKLSEASVELEDLRRENTRLRKKRAPASFEPGHDGGAPVSSHVASSSAQSLPTKPLAPPVAPDAPVAPTEPYSAVAPPATAQAPQLPPLPQLPHVRIEVPPGASSDAAVEAVLAHASHAFTALAELAREGSAHKANATQMWSELSVYRQLQSGWVHPIVQHQWQ